MHERTCTWIRASLRVFIRINANAVSCVRLRACSHTGLIKTQNVFARKNRKTQLHFGFRNFHDVLYRVYLYVATEVQLYQHA